MTQAPTAYSPFPGEPMGEQKTSVMAIVALVCAIIGLLLSCLAVGGVLSIIGVILAVFALLAIASSNGRTGGRGIAITSLVIGLIGTAISITVLVGISQAMSFVKTQMTGPLGQIMTDIEGGNYANARKSLTPAAAAAISDEDFHKFADAYRGEMGKFQHGPQDGITLVREYMQLGKQMQHLQGAQNVFPFTATFDNGLTIVAFQIDQRGGGSAKGQIPVSNIMVIAPSGNKFTLYDPQSSANSPLTMPVPPTPELPPPGGTSPGSPVEPPADEPAPTTPGGG